MARPCCRTYVLPVLCLLSAAVCSPLSAESADEAYSQAEKQMQARDFRAAVKSFRQFFKVTEKHDGKYREAQLRMADCLLEIGEPLQAGRVFQEFTQRWQGDPKEQELRLKLGRSYEARGDFLKAITTYRDFLPRFPGYAKRRELRVYLAGLYAEVLDDYQRALSEYLRLIEEDPTHPTSPELWFAVAQIHKTKSQDFLKAQEAYATIVERFPQHPLAKKAQLELAKLADEKGTRQYAISAIQYRKYLKAYPEAEDRQAIWERLASLYLDRLKQYQNAADAYDEVLKRRDTPQARLSKLRALEKTQNPDRILPAYREFMAKHAKTQEGRAAGRNLASMLWDLDRKEQAIEELSKLVASDSSNIEDRMELARRQTEAGKYEDALKTYGQVAELLPTGDLFVRMSQSPLTQIAVIREQQREENPEAEEFPDTPEIKAAYRRAEEVLLAALAKFPQHADIVAKVCWQLATAVYEPQKDYQKAGEAVRPIFDRFPDYAHYATRGYGARVLLANHAAAERLEAAEDFLRQCEKRHPAHARIREAKADLVRYYVTSATPPEVDDESEEAEEKQTVSPEKAKAWLNRAVNLARDTLKENDSDAAAALAYVYLADAHGALGQELDQLAALARAARFSADSRFKSLSGLFDDRRLTAVLPALRSLTHEERELREWLFKRDANNEGEKQDWVSAGADDSWSKLSAGKDWGDFDGYGWYQISVPLPKSPGQTASGQTGTTEPHRFLFEEVRDVAWVYINGALAQHHTGKGSLEIPFTPGEDQQNGVIRIVVRVKDNGGEGGLTGPVKLSSPKPLAKKDLLKAALCNHATGHLDEALGQYQGCLKELSASGVPEGQADPRPLIAEMQTEIALLAGDVAKVEQSLPKAPDAFLLLRIAQAYESHLEAEKSLELYKRAKNIAPKSPRCIRALAGAYERLSKYEQAVGEYLELLDGLPKLADPGPLQRHIVKLTTDRWRYIVRARELAHKFNEQNPGPYWERTLADLYKGRDPYDPEKAIEHYGKYLSYADKAHVDTWHAGYHTWELYNQLKKYEEAIAYVEEWRKQYPNHPRALEMIYLVGQTHRNQGKMADAARVFTELIAEYPDSYAALLCAKTAIDAFTPDLREGIISKWFELNPGDSRAAEIYFTLGQRYEPEAGGIPRAIDAYRVVWDSFRDKWNENIRAADRLSYLLFATGELEEGAKVAREIIAKFGSQGHAEVTRAWYRLLDYYGPKTGFRAEVDTTYSTGTTPARITDGRTDGGKGNPGYAWLSEVSPREHWVDCVLYKPAAIHRVHLYWGNDEQLPKAYKLQFKRGEEYVDVPGYENWRAAAGGEDRLAFAPVSTDRIRVLQAGSGGSTAQPNLMTVAEIQLFELQDEAAVTRYKGFAGEMIYQYGKRREAFVIIGMTGDAIPSAAVVTDEGSGDALRFDLEDGVEPLLEPYGGPDDPMIVERKIDAALGRNYFTDEFATFVDSVEVQTTFGNERPGAGRQLWVLSFAARNLAPVAAEFGGPETLTMVMDTREKVEAVPTLYTSAGEPCSDAPIGAGGDLDACYCFEAPAGCVPVSVTWQCEQTGLRFVFGGLQEIRSTEELLRAQTPEGETPEPPAAQPTSRRQGRSALTYTDRMVNRANYRFTSSIYNRVGWKLDRAVDRIIDKVLPF